MLILGLLATVAQGDDLIAAVAAAHRDNRAQAADKFASATVDQNAVGKPFAITIPLKDGDVARAGPSTSGFYSYKPETNELRLVLSSSTVRATGQGADGLTKLIYYELFEFGSTRSPRSEYVGQNAYGAVARVSVHRGQSNAIAIVDAPGQGDSYRVYEAKIPVSGPEARRIALDTVVQISGRLALLDHGKLTRCASSYSDATIDNPSEVSISYCFAGAEVQRIAFVRKSTGEVIKEWLTDESAAAGPVLWKDIRYGMTRRQFAKLHPTVEWPKYASRLKLVDGGVIADVNVASGIVTSVDTSISDQTTAAVRRDLVARFGQPQENRCEYVETVCSMVWVTPAGQRVEFESIGAGYKKVAYSIEGKPER